MEGEGRTQRQRQLSGRQYRRILKELEDLARYFKACKDVLIAIRDLPFDQRREPAAHEAIQRELHRLTVNRSRKPPNEPAFKGRLVVGIENESDFGVTSRIIGPGGSNMKRISVEAGGNAKIRVRGRGSGSSEGGPEEADEPLMILVSAENEHSYRIACSLTSECSILFTATIKCPNSSSNFRRGLPGRDHH